MDETHARRFLGLGPAADARRVDDAFRSLAREHHPDRGGDPELFRTLVAARAALRGGIEPAPPARRRPAPVVVVPDPSPWGEVRSALRARRRRAQPERRRVE